jgi:hypothetical protein
MPLEEGSKLLEGRGNILGMGTAAKGGESLRQNTTQ